MSEPPGAGSGPGPEPLAPHLRPARPRRAPAPPAAPAAGEAGRPPQAGLEELARRFDETVAQLAAVQAQLAAQEQQLLGVRRGLRRVLDALDALDGAAAPDPRIDEVVAGLARVEGALALRRDAARRRREAEVPGRP